MAHGMALPLPELRREVKSTCMDTLRSNLTRVLCFLNVIQLNFSAFKFHFLSSLFLWNFTRIQVFGELGRSLTNLPVYSHMDLGRTMELSP